MLYVIMDINHWLRTHLGVPNQSWSLSTRSYFKEYFLMKHANDFDHELKYTKPRMRCCHYLPPDSLHALGASESLSCSQLSLKLIQNVLHRRFIMQTYLDKLYEYALDVCTIWDTQVRSLTGNCVLNTGPYCSDVWGYQQSPRTRAEICRNMSICSGFRAVASTGNYPGFNLLKTSDCKHFVQDTKS